MGKVVRKLERLRTKALVKASVTYEGDFSSTSFIKGFDCGLESITGVLKDKKNKYNSWLKQEETAKLTKVVNLQKTLSYKNKIEIIDELLKDLRCM